MKEITIIFLAIFLFTGCDNSTESREEGVRYTYQVEKGSVSSASLVFKINDGDGERNLPYVTYIAGKLFSKRIFQLDKLTWIKNG